MKNGLHPWPTSPVADLGPGIGRHRLTQTPTNGAASPAVRGPDPDSQAWVDRLGSLDPDLRVAMRDLHALLLNAARFEVDRRRWAVSELRGRDREEFVGQLAASALANVLTNLAKYDGESRFTTWACKFAILEAATRTRCRSWHGRQLPPAPDLSPALQDAIDGELSVHEREVLIAATLNHVPLDVLAERLSMSRGAVYATIQEARRKLRPAVEPHEAMSDS